VFKDGRGDCNPLLLRKRFAKSSDRHLLEREGDSKQSKPSAVHSVIRKIPAVYEN
jgi:hypothetical protein